MKPNEMTYDNLEAIFINVGKRAHRARRARAAYIPECCRKMRIKLRSKLFVTTLIINNAARQTLHPDDALYRAHDSSKTLRRSSKLQDHHIFSIAHIKNSPHRFPTSSIGKILMTFPHRPCNSLRLGCFCVMRRRRMVPVKKLHPEHILHSLSCTFSRCLEFLCERIAKCVSTDGMFDRHEKQKHQ